MKSLKVFLHCAMALAFASLFSLSAYGADDGTKPELKELKRQVEVLTEEVEKLKIGEAAEPALASFSGMGPAASKVYYADRGLSLGGYGEVFYNNYLDPAKTDFAEAYRFVLYGGYKFSDRIIMNSEIEFEHANQVFVEFSYLDFLLRPEFNIRTGLMLVPFGVINEYHEPTVYHGVLRPDVERNVIPSTWRDAGIMAYGGIKGLSYKFGVLNGLRSDKFKKEDWIRGGRQQGGPAVNFDNTALVLSLAYSLPNDLLKAGGSYYAGEAGEGAGGAKTAPNEKKARVNLWEIHADVKFKGTDIRALYTKGSLTGNSYFEASVPGGVGKGAKGWYIEAAHDIMPYIGRGTEATLSPFVRHEKYDTQDNVFAGSKDESQKRTVTTAGVGFKPIPNVVLKADYQWRDSGSDMPEGKGTGLDENKIDQFNLGIGFIF